jgi:hypothetical protein
VIKRWFMNSNVGELVLFFVCISGAVFSEPAPVLRMGRYVLSGTNVTMDINTVELTIYRGNTAVCNGTYRINGNTFTITFCNAAGVARLLNGKTADLTIISDTSFSGIGKIWHRVEGEI